MPSPVSPWRSSQVLQEGYYELRSRKARAPTYSVLARSCEVAARMSSVLLAWSAFTDWVWAELRMMRWIVPWTRGAGPVIGSFSGVHGGSD